MVLGKSIFKANFEESTNVVSDNDIEVILEKGTYSTYLGNIFTVLGFWGVGIFLTLMAVGFGLPMTKKIFYTLAGVMLIPVIVHASISKYVKKHIFIVDIAYNTAAMFEAIYMIPVFYMGMVIDFKKLYGYPWVLILTCIIFIIGFVFFKELKHIKKKLYDESYTKENWITKLVYKLTSLAEKYGVTLFIIGSIIESFINKKIGTISLPARIDSIFKLMMLLFVTYFISTLLFSMGFDQLGKLYVIKYAEDYRYLYDIPKEKWYEPKETDDDIPTAIKNYWKDMFKFKKYCTPANYGTGMVVFLILRNIVVYVSIPNVVKIILSILIYVPLISLLYRRVFNSSLNKVLKISAMMLPILPLTNHTVYFGWLVIILKYITDNQKNN